MSNQTKTFPVQNIDKIDIHCKIFSILVLPSASDQLELSWKDTSKRFLKINANRNESAIYIDDHASIGIYGTLALIDLKRENELIVRLPAGYSGKLILQTNEESIALKNVTTEAAIGISAGIGEITIEKTLCHKLDVRGMNGKVNCYSVDATESIEISTTNAPIQCNLLGNQEKYTVLQTTNKPAVRTRRSAASNTASADLQDNAPQGNGPVKVVFSSDRGTISFRFLNGFALSAPDNRHARKDSFQDW